MVLTILKLETVMSLEITPKMAYQKITSFERTAHELS